MCRNEQWWTTAVLPLHGCRITGSLLSQIPFGRKLDTEALHSALLSFLGCGGSAALCKFSHSWRRLRGQLSALQQAIEIQPGTLQHPLLAGERVEVALGGLCIIAGPHRYC